MIFAAVIYLAVSGGASLPPGRGKVIVQRTCGGCHAMRVVTSKRATHTQWSALVNQMVSRGADLEDDEIDVVVDYLSKNFPVGKPSGTGVHSSTPKRLINVNTATAAQLAAALDLSAEESEAIVTYRKRNGNFKRWNDIAKVPGVDAAKIESDKARLQY